MSVSMDIGSSYKQVVTVADVEEEKHVFKLTAGKLKLLPLFLIQSFTEQEELQTRNF